MYCLPAEKNAARQHCQMMEQFLKSEFCLGKCRCCCKFSQQDSVWSPSLLDCESAQFAKSNIPPAVISQHKKINLLPYPQQNNDDLPAHIGQIFICPFLNPQDSKCKIYAWRPFECQLYPFLINQRGEKIFLAVDLGCPYARDNFNTKEFKEFSQYLAGFFSKPGQCDLLKNNPQIIQVYAGAEDLRELPII